MISMRKFRGNEREFSMWIFPPPFPVESLGIFPGGNFPRAFLINFKMQFNDIGRVSVMWKYPSDDLLSFFGELKCLQVGETFLSFQPRFKNFPGISTWILVTLTTQISTWIPSTNNQKPQGFPTESARFCPLGMILKLSRSIGNAGFSCLCG
mgnify:CR=1 FL=1